MRYWDASALVPLCIEEATTRSARTMARRGTVVTWCLSGIEIASAIERQAREGALEPDGRRAALASLAELARAWTEITGVEAVRSRALRLLATQSLRAADALQLAAALVAVADQAPGHQFVCCDRRLYDAAQREGFEAIDLE